MNWKDYKGIIIVALVVGVILFQATDLENVLLMTGIIVNIIAICLNTGAVNFMDKKPPKDFLPPRRYDLVKKYQAKNKEKMTNQPDYKRLLQPLGEKKMERGKEKRSEDRGLITNIVTAIEPYKGAIDFEDCRGQMYPETATDMIADLSIKHQGINTKRQIAGAMRRRKMMVPFVAQELIDDEHREWWGAYDA